MLHNSSSASRAQCYGRGIHGRMIMGMEIFARCQRRYSAPLNSFHLHHTFSKLVPSFVCVGVLSRFVVTKTSWNYTEWSKVHHATEAQSLHAVERWHRIDYYSKWFWLSHSYVTHLCTITHQCDITSPRSLLLETHNQSLKMLGILNTLGQAEWAATYNAAHFCKCTTRALPHQYQLLPGSLLRHFPTVAHSPLDRKV